MKNLVLLGSAYVSEDSMQMKKKSLKNIYNKKMSNIFLESSETCNFLESKSEHVNFFAPILVKIILHTFQMILWKKKFVEKKIRRIFFFK